MKHKKTIILSVIFLMMLSVLVGCTKKDSAPSSASSSTSSTKSDSTPAKPAQKEIKIGFMLPTMQEARYVKDRDFFIEEAESLGATVVFAEANNDENKQIEQVENFLALGVDVLVIDPVNANAAATFVELAHEQDVPVVAYDRMIANADLDFYMTQDSFLVGVLQAEAAVEYLKETKGAVQGNVVLVSGEAGNSVAEEITRGNMSIIDKYPDLKVVVQQYHKSWAPDLALATMENALTKFNNNIDVMLANNSGMARGALQAIKEQGLAQKIFTAGSDAELLNCQMVLAGEQNVEILKGIIPLAKGSAQVAVALAKGEKVANDGVMSNGYKDVPIKLTPVALVTMENAIQELYQNYVDKGWPPFHDISDLQ